MGTINRKKIKTSVPSANFSLKAAVYYWTAMCYCLGGQFANPTHTETTCEVKVLTTAAWNRSRLKIARCCPSDRQ